MIIMKYTVYIQGMIRILSAIIIFQLCYKRLEIYVGRDSSVGIALTFQNS